MGDNPKFCVAGIGDIDFSRQDSTKKFPLGYTVQDSLGGSWMYVKAGAALTAYLMYKILVDGTVGSETAADDAVDDNSSNFTGGFAVCWPQQAFDSGDYGWVQLSSGDGTLEARVANGVSAGSKLYTSATAGVLAGTAAAHYGIVGEAVSVDAGAASGAITIQVAAPARVDTVIANAS